MQLFSSILVAAVSVFALVSAEEHHDAKGRKSGSAAASGSLKKRLSKHHPIIGGDSAVWGPESLIGGHSSVWGPDNRRSNSCSYRRDSCVPSVSCAPSVSCIPSDSCGYRSNSCYPSASCIPSDSCYPSDSCIPSDCCYPSESCGKDRCDSGMVITCNPINPAVVPFSAFDDCEPLYDPYFGQFGATPFPGQYDPYGLNAGLGLPNPFTPCPPNPCFDPCNPCPRPCPPNPCPRPCPRPCPPTPYYRKSRN